MRIKQLSINQFRNIYSASIHCSSQFNLFFGDNAAGKTSLLEAIYYLSCAKSFRISSQEPLIAHHQPEFSLFAQLTDNNGALIPAGISKSRNGKRIIRLNESTQTTISAITKQLATQFISSNSYTIITDGPKARRHLLDWGLFHTAPHFHQIWKEFNRLLIQRNSALKTRLPKQEITVWDASFVEYALKIDQLRRQYTEALSTYFNEMIQYLLPEQPVQLDYAPGWPDQQSLMSCLSENFYKERQTGHTLTGPHRADLSISVDSNSVTDILSQGQLKMIAYALKLAQGLHLHQSTDKSPVYLIDDLPSELDPDKKQRVIHLLTTINAQVFITGIEKQHFDQLSFSNQATHMFHVKHGQINSIN